MKIILTTVLPFLLPATAWAQSAEVFAADVEAGFATAVDAIASGSAIFDRHIHLEDIGPYNVGVAVVAQAEGTPTTVRSHDNVTEIYYVVAGSGTQVTGTMADGRPSTSAVVGPGQTSNTPIINGKSTRLRAGDIQIIPPGVAHGFSSVDPGGIRYLVFRVDPDHVLGPPPPLDGQ